MNPQELVIDASRAWAPPPKMTVSEWADHYRFLSSESGAAAGKWHTLPFQREIFDAFCDPGVHTVVVMSATQLVKTVFIENALGYIMDRDPGPALLIVPRDSDAERFSKIRLAPMIRDTACLREKVSDVKTARSTNTLNYKAFPGGHLTIAAAGSPGNLAALPIRFLLCDEIDKYPASSGSEGDPISLALKRQATFWNRKTVLCCSPTIDGESRIQKAFDGSDQRHYQVSCPACGAFQPLCWQQVKWDNSLSTKEERARTAHYECAHCQAGWNDVQRWRAVETGHWVASSVCNGVAGFHISELYSPWKKLSEIVQDFLAKKDDPEQLKTFVNTSLAETFVLRGEAPAAEAIYGKREFYEQGVAPAGCLVLTMFVDVQQDRLECELKGWGRDGQSWSVGAEVIAGDTSQQAVWEMLHTVIQQEWPHANGGSLPVWAVGIDSGYRPQKVYDFCARYAQPAYGPAGVKLCAVRTVVPTKGGHGWDRAIEGFSPVDAAKKRGGVRILTLGASYLKQAVYDALRLPVPPPGGDYPAGYWHFPNYEYSWFQGLTSESRIVRENGKPEWVHDKSVRNEPLDLAVGNMAMYILCRTRLDRCSNTDWRRLEEITSGPQQDTPQPEPAPIRQERERWIEKRDWFSRPSDY
jgi:phage terminase large subunit GpA-like protein